MSKSIIIAAAAAFLFATPALAQRAPAGASAPEPSSVRPHHPAFNGPHGSASDLTDRPSSDPTADRPQPRPSGGVTKVGTGTLAVGTGGTAAPHHPAFHGPHGSASDLTDRPPSDPTATAHLKRATLYGRKAGDDKRQDY